MFFKTICFKMNFLCFQVSFGLIVLGLPLRCVSESVKIGIIEHGARREETENIVDGGLKVTLQTYYINVTDSFQVFKTVRLLEDSLDIEFIVIVYDEQLAITNPLITRTENKPVILWGDKPSYSLKNIRHYDTGTTEHYETCQIIEPRVVGSSRAYCIEHLYDVTRTSNGTRIDKVPLDAPNILASLIIKQLSWKQIIIFHENSTEGKVSVLVDILSQRGVLFVLYNLDRLSSLTGVLSETYNKTLSLTTEIHYVVMCEFGCLKRLFKAANDFDIDNRNKTLVKQFSQWLVVSYDHSNIVSETLNTCAGQLDNVAIIPIPEVKTDGSKKVFYESIRETLFRKQHDLSNTSLVHAVLNTVKQKSTMWHPVLRECEALRIETLMYTSRGRHFDLVGYVSMETGDILILSDLFPNTKYGYNKRKFLVSTLHYPPFVIKREDNGTVIYEGMCHDLLAELARTLNFTYDLSEPDDRKWGSPDSNLTFNGMIGQLQREEVDIVAADISIQKEREMVMDFAFPFYYGDTSVLLRKPDPNEGKWRTLVDPFKWRVLVAIGAMLPFASLLAFLLERFNPFFDHPDNAHLPKNCGLKTYIDSFWYMYGALLCQGGVNLPESFAGRTFVSSWWIFSIIIVGIYCGNLIAFLTLSKDKPPFNTLEEMAELSNTYKWGTQAGTHWEFVFVTSSTDEFRKVGDLMIEFNRSDPSVMSVDIDVHLAKVKKGGYGWIGDTVIIEVEIAKNCELMMIKERFLPLKYAFGFTNNSPHTRIFSEQMLSIHESGLLQVWKRKWWPKNSICSGDILPEAKPIKLVDVQSAFYVAAGGIVLGFLAFVSEIFVKRFRKESLTDRQSHITMVSVSNSCEEG